MGDVFGVRYIHEREIDINLIIFRVIERNGKKYRLVVPHNKMLCVKRVYTRV